MLSVFEFQLLWADTRQERGGIDSWIGFPKIKIFRIKFKVQATLLIIMSPNRTRIINNLFRSLVMVDRNM